MERNADGHINLSLRQSKKPPLGVRPRFVFESECAGLRIMELKAALSRFLVANRPLPISFIKEYNELVKDLPIEE